MNFPTGNLLRSIGSPFASFSYDASKTNIFELYRYATKNKVALLYLEALRRLGNIGSLQTEYDSMIARYAGTEAAIHRVSEVLDKAGVDYVFFKSIRPYREVTVDIDILVFGSRYREVIRAMQRAGYLFLAAGPLSTTFRDSRAGIDLDIYDEVGVSYLIYLDKHALTNSVGKSRLSNGDVVRSLYPEADLLAVIAHSVIKEQMYVLSEYYTTLHYLAHMKYDGLNSFLSLVDECRLRSAVEAHLGITALLHYEAHSSTPIGLMKMLKGLDMNRTDVMHVKEKGFMMPYKYHPMTVTKAILEKLGEEKARRSFASQSMNMLNPKFTFSLVNKALRHIFREAY